MPQKILFVNIYHEFYDEKKQVLKFIFIIKKNIYLNSLRSHKKEPFQYIIIIQILCYYNL